jgi:NH3-dependent NAD+ synthetase
MPVLDVNRLIDNRVAAIRAYHEKHGFKKAELDLSGGIDSAVMACLLWIALGPENVTLVHSRFSTSGAQTDRAQRLAAALGIPLNDDDYTDVYDALVGKALGSIGRAHGFDSPEYKDAQQRFADKRTIGGSLRSMMRTPIGMFFLLLKGDGIRHGTGNECEDRIIRFYNRFGDGSVGTNPLDMLSKTEVWQLAWGLGERLGPEVKAVMRDTIIATPSPDLWGIGDGHSDEAEMLAVYKVPFGYGRVDPDTGEILRFGTLERIARFIDWVKERIFSNPDTGLVCDDDQIVWNAREAAWEKLYQIAPAHRLFEGISADEVVALLKAARYAERISRHKMNPNIPNLGSRKGLVQEGILSDDLTPAGVPPVVADKRN